MENKGRDIGIRVGTSGWVLSRVGGGLGTSGWVFVQGGCLSRVGVCPGWVFVQGGWRIRVGTSGWVEDKGRDIRVGGG